MSSSRRRRRPGNKPGGPVAAPPAAPDTPAPSAPSAPGPEHETCFLVPAIEEGSYFEKWGLLADAKCLLVPIDPASRYSVERPAESPFGLQRHLAVAAPDGTRVALVYTDVRLLQPGVAYVEMPVAPLLKRLFTEQGLGGVAFNLRVDDVAPLSPLSGVVNRVFVARLIGMLTSPDARAQGATHVERAVEALRADQAFVACHHALLAREEGVDVESYLFTLVDAYVVLGLSHEADTTLAWYERRTESPDPHAVMVRARLSTLSGKPAAAFDLVRPYLNDPTWGGRAHAERGYGLLHVHEPAAAQSAFEISLTRTPDTVEGLMGRALSLHALGWDPGDTVRMRAAIRAYETVAARRGEHEADARHTIVALYVRLADFDAVEEAAARALAVEDRNETRVNLALALVARGKLEPARVEYDILTVRGSDLAQRLEPFLGPRPAHAPTQM